MSNKHEAEPEIRLSRDEFTARRRALDNNPEAVASQARIDVVDDYGNLVTWVLDLYRVEGQVTAFVQRGASEGYNRFVIPPQVTAAIARHQQGLVTKHRRKVARRVVEDKRARGEQIGNPEALARARKSRRRNAEK